MPPALRCLSPLLVAIAMSAPAAASDGSPREAFVTAFEAADGGDAADDSAALKAYALYPWLQARRLRLRLDDADDALDARIGAFLSAHGSAPYTQSLRAAWWRSLAARERWAEYLAAFDGRPSTDALLCHWLQARMALGRMDGFADDALAAWRNGRSMPSDCDPAFDWLEREGHLTDDRIRERVRLALDAREYGLARYLTERLPEAAQRIWVNARLARQQRGSFLKRLVENPDAPVPFDDLRYGLYAHARGYPAEASRLLDALIEARALTPDERAHLTRAVALPASWSRESLALDLYRRAPLSGHGQDDFEWHVRAALWAGDWDEVARVIAAMPADMAGEARWRYWAARARVATGAAEPAAAYAELARDRSFHGFLAAERAGLPATLNPVPTARDADAQRQLADMPAVRRAREWYALEDDRRASAELSWGLGDLDADGLEQAALMLSDWGWHRQAIAWMARAGRWDDLTLRFPLPHERDFRQSAQAADVPLAWLHAIARTESLYDPRAVSGAGARGIAQIMPGTAQRVAQRSGVRYGGREALFEPATNLDLAARYLAQLRDRFGCRWLFVLPAYNAGPNRIDGWLPDAPLDADAWIANIPFNETRGYVQRALYHYVIIHWRLHGEPGRILPLLDEPVRPPLVC